MGSRGGQRFKGLETRTFFFLFYALLTFIYSYIKYMKRPTNDDGTGSGRDASRAPSVLTTTTTERRTTTTKGARDAYASRAPGMFFLSFSIY